MLKKLLLLSIASLSFISGYAQANSLKDGYYRAKNYSSNRYIYVTDNKGYVDYVATTADVGALQLWKGEERAMSDPSTILYFKQVDDQWDIMAQGTGVYSIISSYVNIFKSGDTYLCYGKKASLSKYLSDTDKTQDDQGIMSIDGTGDTRRWWLSPMDAASNNYLGVKPSISATGKYYQSYYTSFPYSAYSSGVKFYRVEKVERGLALLKEVVGGVPAKTPIIVECSSTVVSDNRLNIGGTPTAVGSNKLSGVFFNNPMTTHYNQTKFNPASMRVLAVNKEGKLVFTATPGFEYIPANTAYLNVDANAPAEIPALKEGEFEEVLAVTPASINIADGNLSLSVGATRKLTVDIAPIAASANKLAWTSTAPSVARVVDGTLYAMAEGEAVITATTTNNLKSSITVKVTKDVVAVSSIALSASSANIKIGETFQFAATVSPANATDKNLTWSSTNNAIATVSFDGVVKGIAPGEVDITAKSTNGVSATAHVVVRSNEVGVSEVKLSETAITLAEGEKRELKATVLPEDATDMTVVWRSSNTAVARVSTTGVVTAVSGGSAVVSAIAKNGVKGECLITVKKNPVAVKGIVLSSSMMTLVEGDERELVATVLPANADNQKVEWKSSDEAIATVIDGKVKAIAEGSAVVTASIDGYSATCNVLVQKKEADVVYPTSIVIDNLPASLRKGRSISLTATVLPADAKNKNVTWTSSNPDVLSVSSTGFAMALKGGEAVVTASTSNGISVSGTVVVEVPVNGIQLTPMMYTGIVGTEFNVEWTIMPADATNKGVKVEVSDDTVLAATTEGVITLLRASSARVRVTTLDGGYFAECYVNAVDSVEELIATDKGKPLYDLKGRLLIREVNTASQLEGLPHGIYILGNRKIIL